MANFKQFQIGENIYPVEPADGTVTIQKLDNELATTINGKANSNEVYTIEETKKEIADRLAEIIAKAPADFDTLKEISDWISTHENSAAEMNTAIGKKYEKPTDGIPSTDLSLDVQTALEKANTAVQTDDSRLSDARIANGGNADTVNSHSVDKDVPSDAVFTDTKDASSLTCTSKVYGSGSSTTSVQTALDNIVTALESKQNINDSVYVDGYQLSIVNP